MAPAISDEEQAGKVAQAVRDAFAAKHLHSEADQCSDFSEDAG